MIATQRPSVDVITGLIKANIPTRIAFRVVSAVDSRTIIDGIGAEDLLGKGDMLYMTATTPKPVRIQGIFVSTKETERVINAVKIAGGGKITEQIGLASDEEGSEDDEGSGVPAGQIDLEADDNGGDDLFLRSRPDRAGNRQSVRKLAPATAESGLRKSRAPPRHHGGERPHRTSGWGEAEEGLYGEDGGVIIRMC